MKAAILLIALSFSLPVFAEETKGEAKNARKPASNLDTEPKKFIDKANGVVCYYISGSDSSYYTNQSYGWGAAAINCLKITDPK